MPSTSPSDPAPALSTEAKKAGKTEKTISEEKSLKKLVSQRKNMFFGRPRMRSFMVTGLSVRFHIFSASLPYSHRNTRDETADRSLRLDGRRGLPYAASVEYRSQIAGRATYFDDMTNSLIRAQGGARALMVALTAIAITACTPAAKTETKLAAVDSSRQMPMSQSMPMNQSMPMGQMTGGWPLGPKTLPLPPSPQGT